MHVVDQLDLVPKLPPHVRHQPRNLLHVVVGPKLSSRAERAVRLSRRLAGALEEVGAGVHLVAVGHEKEAAPWRRGALAPGVLDPIISESMGHRRLWHLRRGVLEEEREILG